jgi:hypothetical protein
MLRIYLKELFMSLGVSFKALIIASVSAFAVSLAMPVIAQDSGETTTQTDQSEEDWRKSKRKESAGDYDPISNPMSSGMGNIMITTDPIDQLPPESRRHLKRQRALAIAGMGTDGEVQDASYEPSTGAQADPNLAVQEEAIWEEMVEGLGSGSGTGGAPGQAVTGASGAGMNGQGDGQGASQGSGQGLGQGQQGQQAGTTGTPQTMRGGSTASASDILSQMRGVGQSGGSVPQGSAQGQGQGQAGTQSGQSGATGQQGDQTGQAQADSNSPQGTDQAGSQTQAASSAPRSPQAMRGGSAASASDILGQMRGQAGDTSQLTQAPDAPAGQSSTARDYESGVARSTSASDYLRSGQDQTAD